MGFLIASVLNVVLMLNLLISILGDTFDQFQIDKSIIDYKEKAEWALEIETLFFFVRKESDSRYMHFCISSNNDEEEQN